MGYPASGYRTGAARAVARPGAFSPRPFGLPGGFGPLGNLPTPANDFGLPIPANDNFKGVVRRGVAGARTARRVLPWLGLALGAYELAKFYHDMNMAGKTVYPNPAWGPPEASCGGRFDTIRWNQTFPNCAGNQVIGLGTGTPQTGPVKGFTFWAIFPLKYYPTGEALFADPGARYGAFYPPDLTLDLMPYVGWPLIDAVPTPVFPAMNPAGMPILQFVPTGQPVPWGVTPHVSPNPDAPASQQYQQGYEAPVPGGMVQPIGDPVPSGGLLPVAPPGTVPQGGTNPTPGTAFELFPNPGPVPNEHTARPPRRREREKKFHVGTGGNIIRTVFDAASEFDDFLDAIFWSIPQPKMYGLNGDRQQYLKLTKGRPRGSYYKDAFGKWRHKGPTIPEKIDFIRKNLGDVDIDKLIKNIQNNQLQDTVWGKAGKATRDAAKRTHDQGLGSPSRGYQLTRFGGFR